ncbi:MAG: hypothetical protein AUI16_02325 [Alphaproteobacteria bacterium 13_2_20CM_2_64_7]|jgi:hypothetical protein|nr:MAG: hypothetical protein AUI16_02325 [Alphaproteobacteria bacterium 13_2_20CM_2_64_7]
MQQRNYMLEALALSRTRQSWNDRLAHWERPASDSEEEMIERAATMVRQIMSHNSWFAAEAVEIAPQGSYYNNTNVRQESDIDLRAVHPMIHVVYGDQVVKEYADSTLRYAFGGRTFDEVAGQMRIEMARELIATFGALNVGADGNKAIRVKGVPGSRAPVDVVPCFNLHVVHWDTVAHQYFVIKGIAIFSCDGRLTINFPDQHHGNGMQKRARTQLRFKRNVRMLKRLRDELVTGNVIKGEEVPSFLLECLVYAVEDDYFLVEADDRYGRLTRVVRRIHEQLDDPAWLRTAIEINGVKLLFGSHQAWTADSAKTFTAAAWSRLLA